jgi:hypothetical protein
VPSARKGWARIDGPWLRLSSGQAFFGVGHNTGWQYDVEQPPLSEMAGKGENLLSFWIATPWAQPSWTSPAEPWWGSRAPIENIEGGVGSYNQAACAYLDAVVARAESASICLLPTIWSHGQLRGAGHPWGLGWWSNNAYSAICSADDFFRRSDGVSETPQWRYQQNFHRYVVARWGYSRAIAAWVTVCEIEGTSSYLRDPAQAQAWCVAVMQQFRQLDPFRVNAAGLYPMAASQSDVPAWDSGLSVRTTDSYQQQRDNIAVAVTIAAETTVLRSGGVPGFHGEFGGDVLNGASQPTHLHNGIWAGVTSGAAMTPLLWCDGGNFPMLTADMQNHLQYLSQFMGSVDYLGDAGLTAASLTLGSPSLRGWGMRLADRGFAWMQSTSGALTAASLSVSGLSPGDYRIDWYDVWSSGAVPVRTNAVSVAADGVLAALVPALSRPDVACRFTRSLMLRHPADIDHDFSVKIGEITAYGAAWRHGAAWAEGPVPIPIGYVTRAAYLWRAGESYYYDPTADPIVWPTNASVWLLAAQGAALQRFGNRSVE